MLPIDGMKMAKAMRVKNMVFCMLSAIGDFLRQAKMI